MEDKAVHSIPWAFLSYIAKKVITLGTTVVLARLLVPADFGIFAAATVAIGSLTVLSDLGVGGVFVVRQTMSEIEKRTVLGIMLVMSATSSAVIAAAAPLIGDFFGDHRIVTVLRVLLISEMLGGFTWFYENALTRELEFRKRFQCEMAQAVVLSSLSIGLAAAGFGYWSVVVGLVAGWATYTVALIVRAPYRVRPALQLGVARDLVRNGRGFIVKGAVSFLQTNADYLAVGRVLGSRPLGFYSMSYRVAEQGYWAVADVIGRVAFPAFARMRHRGEDVVGAFVRVLQLVGLASLPLGVVLSGAARPFTEAVFGDRWLPMVGPLSILGLWAAARPLQYTMSWFLASQDRAGLEATGSLTLFLVQAPLLFVAARSGGIVAVAWVMLAHSVASVIVFAFILRRWMDVGLRRQWGALRPVFLGGALCWATTRVVAGVDVLGSAGAAVGSVGAGLVVYLLVVAVLEPAALRDVRGRVGQLAGGFHRGG